MPAEEGDSPPLQIVGSADPAAFGRDLVAHLAVFRAHTPDRSRPDHAVAVSDAGALDGFAAGILYQRRGLLDHVHVFLLENNFLPGALTSGLLAGLLRPADHHAFAECVKAIHQDLAKTAAVGDQQRDRRDSPYHAEHGE